MFDTVKPKVMPPQNASDDLPDELHFSDRYLFGMLWRFMRPFLPQLIVVFLMILGVTGLTILLPLIVQRAVDGPITSRDLEGLIPLGIAYFAAIVLLFVLRFAHIYLLQTVGQTALVNLRQTLFAHILR
ncbi:MAG: ABC transporter ATP-binding protein, partial [Blastochloris sp.]|nr:ABC transporter ATP-binding protein [Blastochloris sp.]